MDFFSEEPTLLRFCPVVSTKRAAGSLPSAWVLQTAKKICHIVGLLCEAFEEELMALFASIEVGHSEQVSASYSSFGKKRQQKIKEVSLLHKI